MSDYEGDYMCRIGVDVDAICGREAMRVVHEPWTPGNFEVPCCDEHAAHLISSGYHADKEADKQLAKDKEREEMGERCIECGHTPETGACYACRAD